jgi:dihydrofolate reductase
MISLIAAVDQNYGIGFKGKIPWYIPEDFKHFKNTTMGKIVIMGMTTYWSLPEKNRPLPGRENLVLCDDIEQAKIITSQGAKVFSDINSVLEYCKDKDCFVIGGASIYKQFLPHADKIYLTMINKEYECDAFFPKFLDIENYEWKWDLRSAGVGTDKLCTYAVFEKFKKCKYCGKPTLFTVNENIDDCRECKEEKYIQ